MTYDKNNKKEKKILMKLIIKDNFFLVNIRGLSPYTI